MLIRKFVSVFLPEGIQSGFNPSYSGCWFGRQKQLNILQEKDQVSILLILDVDSEEIYNVNEEDEDRGFQSFLFWMLIRKVIKYN